MNHEMKCLKIRIGFNEDHTENSICWFAPSLNQGGEVVYKCPEPLDGRYLSSRELSQISTIQFRYVSISVYSVKTALYLCEVQVLSAASDQISSSQCSDDTSDDTNDDTRDVSAVVYDNHCLHLSSSEKMSFHQGVAYCRDKHSDLIHNKTSKHTQSYNYAK